ncbi:RBBP9/YdeN family alpha/beta hydrolase [Streptomyces sp. WAC 04229]|uniref:RBBP9/YdeN family alpha/beta hydrolase n=1 Tax=Streptomyces sp. WAC 04229 TaxID=2203206 RepID=UPI003D7103B2
MTLSPSPTVVFVPGMRDHVPTHWQTVLARQLPNSRTLPPPTGDLLSLDAHVAELDHALGDVPGPVVLVAHSAGVLTTVHWARRHQRTVRGALLATPPDFETPLPDGYPSITTLRDHGWTPTPRTPLPFPSIVASSSNDPLGPPGRVAGLARAWGSRLVELGAVGHLNPAAGYGEWPRGAALIRELS